MTADRIHSIVRTCIDRCQTAKNPQRILDETLEGLRTDTTWTEEEIHRVEQLCRHFLGALLNYREPS